MFSRPTNLQIGIIGTVMFLLLTLRERHTFLKCIHEIPFSA